VGEAEEAEIDGQLELVSQHCLPWWGAEEVERDGLAHWWAQGWWHNHKPVWGWLSPLQNAFIGKVGNGSVAIQKMGVVGPTHGESDMKATNCGWLGLVGKAMPSLRTSLGRTPPRMR
jgi:hypothetical protein